MTRFLLAASLSLVSLNAFAQDPCAGSCTMGSDPVPYFGARAGVAIPSGSNGVAPTYGVELGLAPTQGLGIGVHFVYSPNPPDIDFIGHASHGFGVEADLRWWLPTTANMQFYPFLSAGFLTGPDRNTGENLLLPLFNPGLGMKLDIGPMYASFEFGLAAAHIPFVNFSVGAKSR